MVVCLPNSQIRFVIARNHDYETRLQLDGVLDICFTSWVGNIEVLSTVLVDPATAFWINMSAIPLPVPPYTLLELLKENVPPESHVCWNISLKLRSSKPVLTVWRPLVNVKLSVMSTVFSVAGLMYPFQRSTPMLRGVVISWTLGASEFASQIAASRDLAEA